MRLQRGIGLFVLVALIIGCSDVPVRAQSRYFYTDRIGVAATADGGFYYSIRLRAIRDLPELGKIRLAFVRPGRPDWTTEKIITAGKRRFSITTPRFSDFSDAATYGIRVVLIADDNVTILDRLSQRFTVPESDKQTENEGQKKAAR